MMHYIFLLSMLFNLGFTSWANGASDTVKIDQHIPHRPASIGIIGDTANVNTPVKAGIAMIGGGKDVDAAFKWLINRSGGGDVVIIRAAGTDAYNIYINQLGKVNSVETLKIDSRQLANNDTVAQIIRNAEMLFIAGGDQSNYMKFWRGTKTMDAINYLLNVKHAPVGGTSAGCAILGGFYYSGEDGSLTADTALANPYNSLVKVYNNDFLHAPYLKQVITDQHYLTRGRPGRHVVFLSRIIKNWNVFAKGIAADERTAVCVDEQDKATIIGSSKAYFLFTDRKKMPELCEPGKPLTWDRNHQAVKVYEIQGSLTGNGSFDVAHFNPAKATGGKWYWWWVNAGKLNQQEIE
ncbi:cyanophycinase [Mucilaginibacter sp. SP1R1]|uniref:cyanophycinase n=1 Tax=Mucilaginibacter sp. SP1R1 TaxID=2723091 RepID=UPI00160F8DC7|nr:cyanophycinase [Mucilaginibacter sp. SP1R1]MBB6150578.1 cyanophycinase-like exopeptidase [Mucilaginibacter sp. SP1R1]